MSEAYFVALLQHPPWCDLRSMVRRLVCRQTIPIISFVNQRGAAIIFVNRGVNTLCRT